MASAAAAPVAATTKSGGLSVVVETTISDINVDGGTLTNAATTSSKLSTIRNPYKKPAAVIPACCTSTAISTVTTRNAATSVTATTGVY